MTSEYDTPGAPADRVERFSWRRQAGFLGAVFAAAAAVLATGLSFTPRASAYSGLSPWELTALLGFLLLLAGACVLLAASLQAAPPPRRTAQAPPAPGTPPDGSFPDGSFPDGSYPDGTLPHRPAAEAGAPDVPAPDAPAGTGQTRIGTLLGTIGLALAAVAVLLAVLLPRPTAAIMVQFTDLAGRVQLEYCPTLPGSFAGTASHDDLAGSSPILPVKVTAEACGNPEYTEGVWIYLNRASVTVADAP